MSAFDFDAIIKEGIDRIYENDYPATEHRIKAVAKFRNMDYHIMLEAKAFFVPNDEYMKIFFGELITMPEFDCYDSSEEICYWLGYLVFPIYDALDDIVGLVGFNPINKEKTKDPEFWSLSYYRHSSKKLMDRKKFLFGMKGLYLRALEEGYIILTDGVFDTINGAAHGLVTGALLGSYFGLELIAILKFIPIVYLAVDDDNAGLQLLERLREYLPNIRAIRHNIGKDLDDILKSEYCEDFLKEFRKNKDLKIPTDLIYRRKLC